MSDKLKYQVPIDMLQDMCAEKGLKTDGDRADLIARLKAAEKLKPEPEAKE